MSDQPQKLCPDCGAPLDISMKITFSGSMVEAIHKMAARRKESVDQFLFHLLWLEAGKVPGARELLERED